MGKHQEGVPPFGSQIEMGANGLSNTAATRFLSPGYNSATASVNALDMQVVVPFTVYRLDMKTRVAGAAGQTMTGVLRKNGAATGMTLATASDALTGSQTGATPISFAPGDTWGLEVDKSGAFNSPTDIFYTLGIYT